MHRAAMAPQRRTNRADARAASALLPPELAARAADFALVLGLVRARAQTAQIPARSFVQQVWIHLRAKHRVGELHLPDLLAIQIDYIHDRHNLDSFFSQLPLRKIPLTNCYEHVATSRVFQPEPGRLPSWRSSRCE